jgi:hypothetical protein
MAKKKSLVATSLRKVIHGIYAAAGKEIDLLSMTSP